MTARSRGRFVVLLAPPGVELIYSGAMGLSEHKMDLPWVSRTIAGGAGPESVERVVCALANRPGFAMLDSLCGHPVYGRYCILCCDPIAVVRSHKGNAVNPFDALEAKGPHLGCAADAPDLPFTGGWLGCMSYEAGRFLERLPGKAACDLDLDFAWFGLYDTAATYDRHTREWKIVGVACPGNAAQPQSLQKRLAALEQRVLMALAAPPPAARQSTVRQELHFDRRAYTAKIKRILDHIRAGDVYQVNLTQRFAVDINCSSLDVYRRLRHSNRGDQAAFLRCGDYDVLCTSPELFLECRGGQVLTRPIKGTRPRARDEDRDRAHREELLSSEKDRAELAMIVDLERNDLGRVCSGITAEWPPVVESYDTVHHLVTDVRGTLQDGRSPMDLLRACFPGGSITGCPKIRAMEIIDDLEAVARGPYCGAIGYIGLDGSMCMNVAIRTMVIQGGSAYIHAGGGIVADSSPDAELDEVLSKAEGMFRALNISPAAASPVSS